MTQPAAYSPPLATDGLRWHKEHPMPTDPSILKVESLRLRRAIASKREQCRQAYADRRMEGFHRFTGEVESLGLLMLRVAEQMEVAS